MYWEWLVHPQIIIFIKYNIHAINFNNIIKYYIYEIY